MVVCAVWGVLAVGILPFAVLDMGSYTVNGESVSGPEFVRRVGLGWGTVGVLCLAIASAVYRNRPWSRHLMLAYWPVIGLFFAALGFSSSGTTGIMTAAAFASVGLLGAYLYLYRKRNVTAYFAALAYARRAGAPSASA
jgi:hypothetical protein